jgi:hypothetical protein
MSPAPYSFDSVLRSTKGALQKAAYALAPVDPFTSLSNGLRLDHA